MSTHDRLEIYRHYKATHHYSNALSRLKFIRCLSKINRLCKQTLHLSPSFFLSLIFAVLEVVSNLLGMFVFLIDWPDLHPLLPTRSLSKSHEPLYITQNEHSPKNVNLITSNLKHKWLRSANPRKTLLRKLNLKAFRNYSSVILILTAVAERTKKLNKFLQTVLEVE